MDATLARVAPTPLDMLQHALQNGVEPAQLKEMMDLANAWKQQESAERFGEALASFQADCPQITKFREVKNRDGGSRYHFAAFEDIDVVVRPILARYRVSASFTLEARDGFVHCNWRLQVGSHWVDKPYRLPLPNLEKLAADTRCNELQAEGNLMTYLRRYTFCAALGIVVTGEDNDASAIDVLTPAEVAQIKALIVETAADEARFLKWAACPKVEDMPRSQFPKALDMLKRKARVAS